jgi:hypothetical protein
MNLFSKEKFYGCSFCKDPWDDNSPRGLISFNTKDGSKRSELSVWTCINGHIEGKWEVEKNGRKKVKNSSLNTCILMLFQNLYGYQIDFLNTLISGDDGKDQNPFYTDD